MNVIRRKPMTREAFLEWADAQEGLYEFDGVEPRAMTGSNAAHAVIRQNLAYFLFSRLVGTSFRVFGPETGIATSGDAIRCPDVFVTGTQFGDKDRLIPEPIIVCEVLSPTSGTLDRVVKVREYALVPSIRRYVIIDQDRIGALVHDRSEDETWRETPVEDGGMLFMPEIGVSLYLDSLYAGTSLAGPV